MKFEIPPIYINESENPMAGKNKEIFSEELIGKLHDKVKAIYEDHFDDLTIAESVAIIALLQNRISFAQNIEIIKLAGKGDL